MVKLDIGIMAYFQKRKRLYTVKWISGFLHVVHTTITDKSCDEKSTLKECFSVYEQLVNKKYVVFNNSKDIICCNNVLK